VGATACRNVSSLRRMSLFLDLESEGARTYLNTRIPDVFLYDKVYHSKILDRITYDIKSAAKQAQKKRRNKRRISAKEKEKTGHTKDNLDCWKFESELRVVRKRREERPRVHTPKCCHYTI